MTTNQTITGVLVPRETLQKWLDDIGPSRHVTQYAALKRDELRALLEAPAESCGACNGCTNGCRLDAESPPAKPQGDTVTFPRELSDELGELIAEKARVCGGGAFEIWEAMCEQFGTPAEQPAPVAVVLPERKENHDSGPTLRKIQADGWNACLDEVARLTATVRIPERLIMTDGLQTYEYVTGHNAAIDKMLGVKS